MIEGTWCETVWLCVCVSHGVSTRAPRSELRAPCGTILQVNEGELVRVLLQVTPLQVTPFYALGFLFFMLLFHLFHLFSLLLSHKNASRMSLTRLDTSTSSTCPPPRFSKLTKKPRQRHAMPRCGPCASTPRALGDALQCTQALMIHSQVRCGVCC